MRLQHSFPLCDAPLVLSKHISMWGGSEKTIKNDEKHENYPVVQLSFSRYNYSKHHTKLKQTKKRDG